jgi:hypothetical protein
MALKRTMQAACLLALACGMLAGCKKDGGEKANVQFSAASKAVATRTAYSGEGQTGTSGSLVKERIDWVVDDAITILSDKAVNMTTGEKWGDYKILTVTADGVRSKATLKPVDVNSLQWGAEGTYKFYARYPADATKLTETSMTATIPATQQMKKDDSGKWVPDMDNAFMLATATATNTKDPVELDFYPEFTALQFEIGAGGNGEAKISSFTLTSTSDPLAGDFSVACATGAASTASTTKTLSMDVTNRSDDGVLVITGGGESATITLFALPTDFTNLTLTVVGQPFGTRTLKLADKDGNMIPFTGGKKYWIKGLDLPELLEVTGENINWDVEARGESIYWD